MLRCIQLNCHHSKISSALLTKKLNSVHPTIALITEPWLAKGKRVAGLPSGDRYYAEGARAAIICKNIKSWPIPQWTDKDTATANIMIDKKRAVVSSVYWDITEEDPPKILESLAKQKDVPVIIGMDSNAHSTTWGSKENNKRGERLEEILLENDLHILNQGSKATFIGAQGESVIDLTLTNQKGLSLIEEWKVEEEDFGSDHRAISFVCKHQEEWTESRNLKRANWYKFRKAVQASLHPLTRIRWTKSMVEEEARAIETVIIDALDLVAPSHRRKVKENKLTWWSSKLNELRKKMNNLKDKTGDLYKKVKREFQKELMNRKQESWRKWVTGLQDHKEINKFLNIAKETQRIKMGSIKLASGEYTVTEEEALEALLEEHFPGSLKKPPTPQDQDRSDFLLENSWITGELVEAAIKSFGDNKAPGPDGIKPLVLKHLPREATEQLATLYKAILATGSTPSRWRESKVVFIPKPGKKDYSERRSYRPISLTSFLLKTLERLINWKLEADELTFNKNQHAFQRGKSTESALIEATGEIKKALKQKEIALAVFLDIAGAFDNVNLSKAKEEMANHNIPADIRTWYGNFLDNRSCKAGEMVRYLTRGTPQGGVLSPKVWNMIFDGLLELFRSGPIKAVGFADDGLLLIRGKDLGTMTSLMTAAIRKVTEWGQLCGLSFSAEKTTVVAFTWKKIKSQKNKHKVKMGGREIPYSNEAKYLGVTMDSRLTWTTHVKEKINKAKRLLFAVKRCSGVIWGPKPKIMQWLYKGIVRPAITYGAVVWKEAVKKATIRKELDKIQRLALTCSIQVKRSTPVTSMEIILNITPLHLHIEETAKIAETRLGGEDGWDMQRKSTQLDNIKEVVHWTGEDKTEGWRMYTDGSRTDTGAGAAVVLMFDDIVFDQRAYTLQKGNTAFQAEITAIREAGRWAEELDIEGVTIMTDCQTAIKAMNNLHTRSRLVQETRKEMNELVKTGRVTEVHWIRAHKGYLGNEIADRIAKEGAEGEGIKLRVALPFAIKKTKIKEETGGVWKKEWKTCKIKGGKDLGIAPGQNWASILKDLNRKELGQMIRLLTGHNYLRGGIWQAQGSTDRERTIEISKCRRCQEEIETTSHLIARCPAVAYQRWTIFEKFFITNIEDEEHDKVHKFLCQINIKVWEEDGLNK